MTEAASPTLDAPRIDQIPTAPSVFKAVVASFATLMLSLLGVGFMLIALPAWLRLLERNAELVMKPATAGLCTLISIWLVVIGVVGLVGVVAGGLSLVRVALTRRLLQVMLGLVYPAVLGYVVLVWLLVSAIVDGDIAVNGVEYDTASGLILWWQASWPALAAGACALWLHVLLASRSVAGAFTKELGPMMRGDRILEDWRTHGKDPRARKSMYASIVTHVLVLVVIPWLLQIEGCNEAYRVPKGSGQPVVAQVKFVKPKEKKEKTLTLRPNSAIIFEVPDLDDTEVDKMMEQMTTATYQAAVNTKPAKLGSGGGTKGGWPQGMENYKIRFIRLKHGGNGWDDGMNQTGADVNFLRAFARISGFNKIASKGEAHSISRLDNYPEDGFPPFVYLTGNGNMGRTNKSDWTILRNYCLNGGMLIADAGSSRFDRSFRRFIRQVFPDKQLLDIADDDMIYQLPFTFTTPPAFWHHGGRRPMGIKHEGRWIVFYHPGDMNDAWKSPGYSDVTPKWRDDAYQLGTNLVVYSFNQWNAAVERIRK